MTRRFESSCGFGLAELLIGLVIGLAAAAAVAVELRASLRAVRTHGEAIDVTQRARGVHDSLAGAIASAGRGLSLASRSGWTTAVAPRVVPARFAVRTSDPPGSAFTDRITVLAARSAPRSSTLAAPMGTPDALLAVAPLPGCRVASPTCDLDVGDLVIVADRRGHADVATVTAVADNLLAHDPVVLSHAYDPADDVKIIPLEVRSLAFDALNAQLREYRGRSQALVVADDVVRFHVRYFGTAAPPSGAELQGGSDTCVVAADGSPKLPALPAGTAGLVELSTGVLGDGPFCGAGTYRFDADLLRVRLIRATFRVQAADAAVRGRSPALFLRPGRATDPAAEVPDQEVTCDVSVRNVLTAS